MNKFITQASDLVTTSEETRAGFLSVALEKNKVSDPYVKNALAFKAMVAGSKGPDDLLAMPSIRPFMLTASGLSDKSMNHLCEEDQTRAIKELIEKFLKPAGKNYVDEVIYRYLLIKGDAVGGTMRNRIGALGQEKLIRGILSSMNVQEINYDWMANGKGKSSWNHKSRNDMEIEKNLKALHWSGKKGDRVLAFNLKIPTVSKNVDICLFDSSKDEYSKRKIVKSPEKIIMLGELKGGIDPAGADEHWKTADSALRRIRTSFKEADHLVKTSFVGAAIEKDMSEEIFKQLKSGILDNAANLTDSNQLTEYANWILSI